MAKKTLQHEILTELNSAIKRLGRKPSRIEFLQKTSISEWKMKEAFGSFSKMMKAGGVDLYPEALPAIPDKPRIIIFDLETLPNPTEAVAVWPQISDYPGKTLRATITSIICAGWKELGSKKTHCINAWDFPNWKKDKNDDSRVAKAIYDVLNKADAVVTHNGKRFDWKYLQTRLMVNGLDTLDRTPHLDTKAEASRNLFLFNNRLGTLGKFLAGDHKLDTGGWQLWVDVFERKKKAMELMTRYCKQDVDLLEKCFVKMRPFFSNIPNYNLFGRDQYKCPSCGASGLIKAGWRLTKTTRYMRMRCKECSSYSRVNKKLAQPRSV